MAADTSSTANSGKRAADKSTPSVVKLSLAPADNARLANLCGPLNSHLRQLEQRLNVTISNRGCDFQLRGEIEAVNAAAATLKALYQQAASQALEPEDVHLQLREAQPGSEATTSDAGSIAESRHEFGPGEEVAVRTKRGVIRGRGANQKRYLQRILDHDINFGIGPAGTGKTYLAVACAVHALEHDLVRRLVLVRPAVEAGERLGFLPGDLAQKIDPYLRPLYDALYEMLGFEKVERLMERNVIEVAPLAYMRGRTLNEAFVILDEAQNTSAEQMKMFLTRIGFGSKAVITGDLTQIDLPRSQESGLRQSLRILKDVEGLSFTHFAAGDVVRHPLVQRIVRAYDAADAIAEEG